MIVLLRHGRTEGGEGLCIGRTPLALSAEGGAQADAVAAHLADAGFARLCASPARRAVDTITPLAETLGKPVDIIPELDEIDMGAWDGVPFAAIRQEHPEAYARRGAGFARFRPPGGESFNDVAARAMGALARLAKGPLPVLAATHAGVIRAVLCRVTGHSMDDLFHFSPVHAHLTVLETVGRALRLAGTGIPPEDLPSLLRTSGDVA